MVGVDGFDPKESEAFVGYSPEAAERFYAGMARLGDRLRVDVVGLEHLPEGRALLVANHAFGWDVAFAMAAIRRETGRTVWALGEHAWWMFPFVRRAAAAVGVVDGTPENAGALLDREQLVLVLPGGLREAVKPRELRYRLLWGHRYGFVRSAMQHQAPIVPLATIGADDMFRLVGDAYARGERLLRRRIPLPRLRWPRRQALRFVLGEPIRPVALPGDSEETTVKRIRREVEGALHEIFERELAARAGIEL
jgi:1-acyl-sn-glycerol-3-phosphate acyltransferase